jgi:hypothetical protein
MHILPAIGAAVALAAILTIVASLLQQRRGRARAVFIVLTVPLLSIGVATQIVVQQETRVAWSEQKSIWQQLFHIAPDLAGDTGIYLSLPSYQDRLSVRPFIDGSWGAGTTAAVRMFYCNDNLHGYFTYDDFAPSEFRSDGIVRPWGVVPYDRVLILRYERKTGELVLLDRVPAHPLGDPAPIRQSLGIDRILYDEGCQSTLRELVR